MSEEPIQESKKSAKFALFIALLALSFTAIGITAGYKHWLRIHVKTKEALTEIKLLKEKMAHTADKKALNDFEASFKNSTNQEREALEKALVKLDHVSKQTNYAASTVSQQIKALTAQQEQQANNKQTTPYSIQYAYVPFILQTAQRQLHFLHDKEGALALLKIADQMLIESGSTNHLLLRQRIATDIAALQHYKTLDIEAISTTISQLETQITPLMAIEDKNTNENILETSKETNSLATNIKNYLKQSITLQKTNEPPRQLLAAGDQKRIDQLIQLRLESLHLMLLQRQNKAYHWQINRLIKTLSRYYPEKQAAPWINTLEDLANIQLNPPAPALTSNEKSPLPFKQEK